MMTDLNEDGYYSPSLNVILCFSLLILWFNLNISHSWATILIFRSTMLEGVNLFMCLCKYLRSRRPCCIWTWGISILQMVRLTHSSENQLTSLPLEITLLQHLKVLLLRFVDFADKPHTPPSIAPSCELFVLWEKCDWHAWCCGCFSFHHVRLSLHDTLIYDWCPFLFEKVCGLCLCDFVGVDVKGFIHSTFTSPSTTLNLSTNSFHQQL